MTLLCFSLLIICSYTDLRERGISLALLAVFSMSCSALLVSVLIFGDRFGFLRRCLVYEPGIINIFSGLIPGLILLVICRFSGEAVGLGDVYVVMLIGLMLGFEKTFSVLFLSMLMTALFGLVCMVTGSRSRKDSLPYIPFVLAAFSILILSGRIPVLN